MRRNLCSFIFISIFINGNNKMNASIPTTNSNQAILTSSRVASYPHYQEFSPAAGRFFSPEAPGYNTPDDDPKFHNVKVITFKAEDLSTGNLSLSDQDADKIGYFWNTKDSDPSLIYPGKARIGNEQFINVVAVDSTKVDHTDEEDNVGFTDQENIYNPYAPEKNKFQNDFLVKIGSFVQKGKLYDLYGQYMATVVPDPENNEYV